MSSLLLFVSLLAGSETKPATPHFVSCGELAQALVFNEAKADSFFGQKEIYLTGDVERIVRVHRAATNADGSPTRPQNPDEGVANSVRYAILMRTQFQDQTDRRDVIVRCLFPGSARDQLAGVRSPGSLGYIVRGRLRQESLRRDYVILGTRQVMADVVDIVDCELITEAEALRQLSASSAGGQVPLGVPAEEEDTFRRPTTDDPATLGAPAEE